MRNLKLLAFGILGLSFFLVFNVKNLAFAGEYVIDKDQSVFVVITHKEGFASAMAHDHFIYPSDYEAKVSAASAERVEDGKFTITFPVENLVVDNQVVEKKWFPRIKALGIKKDPFPDVSKDDKGKIRASMLDKGQLDVASYPTISAKLVSIELRNGQGAANSDLTHTVAVETTIHGKTVKRDYPAKIARDGGTLNIEAVGEYRFTEFGIEPYSAFFGAVKNQDKFHLYVNLTARVPVATEDTQ